MSAQGSLPARAPEYFMDRILVDCPACGGVAVVSLEEDAGAEDIGWASERLFAARRMTCTRCAAHRRQGRRAWSRPTMGLPLRLRTETRHGLLYAWNEAHLGYIEDYVRSTLRHETVAPGGVRNASVLSRLPAWAKAAKNRDEVPKAIAAMRRRLA